MTDLIRKDNVYISDALDSDSLFEEVYKKLYAKDLVKENFLEKIKEREASYPTGLDMSVVDEKLANIAIPHTDPDTCRYTGIVPIKLNNKIKFNNIIDPSIEMDVSFAFIILNEDGNEQTDMLANIMDFVTKTEDINKLFEMDDTEEIYNFIEGRF